MVKRVEFTHTTPLVSGLLEQAWYASPTRELYVRLKGGNTYGYSDVSPMAYENFCFAESKGKFYNSKVKGVYKSTGNVADEVEFVSAPGLSKSKTVEKPYIPVSGYTTVTWPSTSANKAVPVAEVKQGYRVAGTVLQPTPVAKVYQATSLEDAMKKFRDEFKDKDADVTSVSKV